MTGPEGPSKKTHTGTEGCIEIATNVICLVNFLFVISLNSLEH